MDKETKERIALYAQNYVHQEYPKMRHHPDGREVTVHTEAQESALGAEWMDRADAVAERERRNKRDAEKIAVAQGAAAVASRK